MYTLKRRPVTTLVQITLVTVCDDLRLRRLTYGKPLPFRWASDRNSLVRAGWKAEPTSLRGRGRGVGTGRKAGGFPQVGAAEPRSALAWAANLDSSGP
jgi:hypothetical protein